MILTGTGIFVSHMCDALQLEYLLPTDAHNPETFLEDVDNIYDENRSGPNQDRLRDSQYRRLPPAIGHEDQPGREDGSQYSPEDFEDEISDRHFGRLPS